MRLPFTILVSVAIVTVVWADTIVNVQRRPEIVVTLDADSNTVSVVTGVTYIVDIPKPDGIGGFHDEVHFDSLAAVLANSSIVTNTIMQRAVPWNVIFNAHWNLADPDDINFTANPPVVLTNVQERVQ